MPSPHAPRSEGWLTIPLTSYNSKGLLQPIQLVPEAFPQTLISGAAHKSLQFSGNLVEVWQMRRDQGTRFVAENPHGVLIT